MSPLRSLPKAMFLTAALGCCPPLLLTAQQDTAATQSSTAAPMFKATVRRVVLDVVVTDSHGKPVSGLTKADFSIAEDSKPQPVLSFDAYGFERGMDYLPPKLPPEPPNTFVNLPATPEKGPLYVLLYDLVNMDSPDQQSSPGDFKDQMFGRQQLLKFIQNKPEGARFAIFVWSDGLHLVQGFTSDKEQLYAAVDPQSPKSHIPKVFMMGPNFGQGNSGAALGVLSFISTYLDGLPGRKNLIWFSGTFPLSLFPNDDDGPTYVEQVKTTLDLLARDQVAIYPVDVRGVVIANTYAPQGATSGGGLSSDSRDNGLSAPGQSAGANRAAAGGAGGGQGYSLLANSYITMDAIAGATGGKAFYSSNDVKAELADATETGASYYTLTYSPSNRDYNGKLRNIRVELAKKGYTLAYRRSYYGAETDTLTNSQIGRNPKTPVPDSPRKLGDTLYANMEHGAPIAHQLIFGAHVRAVGAPAKGTPEQMAQLSTQPAFFKSRRRNAAAKPLPPIDLQKFAIDYTVMTHQLRVAGGAAPPSLEIAAAAYDADGKMLNAIVNNAVRDERASSAMEQKSLRAEQQMDLPLNAVSIRVAVRDKNTDRIGAMEIKLPLGPENESATAPNTRKEDAPAKLN